MTAIQTGCDQVSLVPSSNRKDKGLALGTLLYLKRLGPSKSTRLMQHRDYSKGVEMKRNHGAHETGAPPSCNITLQDHSG